MCLAAVLCCTLETDLCDRLVPDILQRAAMKVQQATRLALLQMLSTMQSVHCWRAQKACMRKLTVFGIVLMVCAVPQLPILRAAGAPQLAIAEPHGELGPARHGCAVADFLHLHWCFEQLCRALTIQALLLAISFYADLMIVPSSVCQQTA